jgi:hypothetical protein
MRADPTLLQETDVVFFQKSEAYFEASLAVHRRMGLPTDLLDNATLRELFHGVQAGLVGGGSGHGLKYGLRSALMRRLCQKRSWRRRSRASRWRHQARRPPP